MSRAKRGEIEKKEGRKRKIRIRYLIVAGMVTMLGLSFPTETKAENCPELRVVFARGSGGERWTDQNYLAYKTAIEEKLKTTSLSYEIIDLDYPAVAVGVDSQENLLTALGAYIGSGETFRFGESVSTGVENLVELVNNSCPNTKYVIGGYSQGAMVISKALKSLNADKIIYAATFGDPKIYLPEGAGVMPAACFGMNLSEYRMYVPDCMAYKGLLGGYEPYQPEGFSGKVGTWCNGRDVFCSSKASLTDHLTYVSDDLYEDASKVIFDKITEAFGIENTVTSLHDTAILIDSTGSMGEMIGSYKNEALRLAEETLAAGGRVALYDYRDLDDPYEAIERCNFETCDLETFTKELNAILIEGGGDSDESLLSASLTVMKKLNWRQGATKSLVVLTDAGFVSPDRDGTTITDVIKLSREIDPVNFYIITEESMAERYTELASETDGKVVTDFGKVSLLTDYIMARYDSLPRVEESETAAERPELSILATEETGSSLKIRFQTNGEQTLVIVNDVLLGATAETEIEIGEVTAGTEVRLVPVLNETKGEGVVIAVEGDSEDAGGFSGLSDLSDDVATLPLVPGVPDTGGKSKLSRILAKIWELWEV